MKKGQRRFREKARIFHESPCLLNPSLSTITKRWVGCTAAGSFEIILFKLDLSRSRSVLGSTLHIFLAPLSRLERRQKVLHYPDFNFVFAHARGESEVVTIRMERNFADEIHGQPQSVRVSAARRDGQ